MNALAVIVVLAIVAGGIWWLVKGRTPTPPSPPWVAPPPFVPPAPGDHPHPRDRQGPPGSGM